MREIELDVPSRMFRQVRQLLQETPGVQFRVQGWLTKRVFVIDNEAFAELQPKLRSAVNDWLANNA